MRADEGKPVQHAAEGPAVTIRPARAEDLPVLFLQQLDPVATRMAAFPPRDEEAFFAQGSDLAKEATAAESFDDLDEGVDLPQSFWKRVFRSPSSTTDQLSAQRQQQRSQQPDPPRRGGGGRKK